MERSKYTGVRFFSKDDLSLGHNLFDAAKKLESFDPQKECLDINEILELYNIHVIMWIGIYPRDWDERTVEEYKRLCKPIMGVVARYFANIGDKNFIEEEQRTSFWYLNDFWSLITKFRVYERISGDTLLAFLKLPDTALYKLLQHEELVNYYDVVLAEFMRESDQTADILINTFLKKGEKLYHIPRSLKKEEYEPIFLKHIDSSEVNLNNLQLLYNSQSSQECPFSDRVRLKAKHAYKAYWEKNKDAGIKVSYGIAVGFDEQEEPKRLTVEGDTQKITYDYRWFEENLDYPTILNNFIYFFEMFDYQSRCSLVSVKSKISAIERAFSTEGIRYYEMGNGFRATEMLSSAQMNLYYNFLRSHAIDLEEVFKWFFETYLTEEFGAKGFVYNASSKNASWLEKCRNIVSEMDGILKQFRQYVQFGEIDRELFEMSSSHMLVANVPSFIEQKYAYVNGSAITNAQFALFSDQSSLGYTDKMKDKHSTLFDLLKKEEMYFSDFHEYQQNSIHWLIDQKCLEYSENGVLRLARYEIALLKDLYDHDVTCLQYYSPYIGNIDVRTPFFEIINRRVADGDLTVESTLFSKPEQDYLNYVLNKSAFSNGLDLRNKYSHSTYHQDEKTQQQDCMELLKVMLVVVVKINEEFCLRESIEKKG